MAAAKQMHGEMFTVARKIITFIVSASKARAAFGVSELHKNVPAFL